ncbi:MAG: hypothetical protein RLZZ187_2594 [Pseudomonadota bacterium]|jgi:hypothetical protein
MFTHAQLVEVVDRHLVASGESASAFGRRVANDPRLVFDLREGRSPQLRLVERILAAVVPAPSAPSGAEAA